MVEITVVGPALSVTVCVETTVLCLTIVVREVTVEIDRTVVGVATHRELARYRQQIYKYPGLNILGTLEVVDFVKVEARHAQALEILAG